MGGAFLFGFVLVALGAVAVGLSGGFAAPGVGRWTWGLLASLFPGLLAAGCWLIVLVIPEGFEALEAFAEAEAIELDQIRGSLFSLLAIITAYPVVTLVGATGGAGASRALSRRLPDAESPAEEDPPPEEFPALEVAPLRLARVPGSWCHRVFYRREELALLEILPGARGGGFELDGCYYKVTARLFGSIHTLSSWGRPLASADVGLTCRIARIEFDGRELSLRPRVALAPVAGTLILEESGRYAGRLERRPVGDEGRVAELARDLPLPVRFFVIYLAVVLWMRWSVSEVRRWRPAPVRRTFGFHTESG